MLRWFKGKKKKSIPKYSNDEWVGALRPPPEENMISILRAILVRGLNVALVDKIKRDREALVQDFTQNALLKILKNIELFRGDSHFITWAMKIAVREALTELRHEKWKEISIDELKSSSPNSFDIKDAGPTPDNVTSQNILIEQLSDIIDEVLTEKQKLAIKAVMINGMPLDVVAEQLGTNRNNLYKLLHDARKKLKYELTLRGLTPEELLEGL